MSNRSNHDDCRRTVGWVGQSGEDRPAFDTWLQRELTRLYDPVLREPLPPALLELLAAAPDRSSLQAQ
jgi:hypothetical protein